LISFSLKKNSRVFEYPVVNSQTYSTVILSAKGPKEAEGLASVDPAVSAGLMTYEVHGSSETPEGPPK
jgi:hypothetical protein